MAVTILDQVQVLDQEIAGARGRPGRAHLVERLGLDLAALGVLRGAVAPSGRRALVGPRIHAWNPSQFTNNGGVIKSKPSTAINRLKFSINYAILGNP